MSSLNDVSSFVSQPLVVREWWKPLWLTEILESFELCEDGLTCLGAITVPELLASSPLRPLDGNRTFYLSCFISKYARKIWTSVSLFWSECTISQHIACCPSLHSRLQCRTKTQNPNSGFRMKDLGFCHMYECPKPHPAHPVLSLTSPRRIAD